MAQPRTPAVRLEPLFQQAREPVFALNPARQLVWVNRAWEELTGLAADAALGLPCNALGSDRVAGPESLAAAFAPPAEALAGRAAAVSALIPRADGERLWKRLEFWPLANGRGEPSLLLGIVRDRDEPAAAPEAESNRLHAALVDLRERSRHRAAGDELVGAGPAHRRLLDQIDAASGSLVPVLIVGEPGTGKRLVGRTIHQHGPRPQGPLVALDCEAFPPDALERRLFGPPGGHGRGVALAEGATLLIGDVAGLPRDLQGKLAAAAGPACRLIATTATAPDEALRADRLRPDFYYLLTTLVIALRPLRERLEELPLIAQHLLERLNRRGGRQRVGFEGPAVGALLAYDWPGNLRELARVIEAAHAQGGGDLVALPDLPAGIRGDLGAAYNPPPAPPPPAGLALDELLARVERRLIEDALKRARDNKSKAADALGVSRPRLYRRMKELGMDDGPEGAPAADRASG